MGLKVSAKHSANYESLNTRNFKLLAKLSWCGIDSDPHVRFNPLH